KALAAREQAKCPRGFFDSGAMIKANAAWYFPYTPSLPMLYGLRESLAMLSEEGLDNVFARHHRLAEGVRAAVRAWGLKLCAKAPKWYSDTVSAIMVPEGFNGADVIDVAFRRYDLALGAGLARMSGKLFRIGHLGDLNELMLLGAIAGAEMAMRDLGIKIEAGSGVAAAAEHYRSTAPPLAPRAAAPSPPDCWSTTGRAAARRCACASTGSTPITCIATSWTWSSRRGTASTSCWCPRWASQRTCTWSTPCSRRSGPPGASPTASASRC